YIGCEVRVGTSRCCRRFAFVGVIACLAAGDDVAGTAVADEPLAPCPASPNCVSSLMVGEMHVDPLTYSDTADAARQRLLAVLAGVERATPVGKGGRNVGVEFRSAVFGFIDDVEFRFEPPGQIQVRSASRTGHYDFGVNRRRVEAIRDAFAASSQTTR
ncbi:DUF1499 domain-containing protein, partial [Stenotrophomonas africana]|uniref:DUF1499 domain-containing protein n=1 Tax=Stenotrophomonas africana TaxID=1292134 RepID=UPI00128F0FA8